MNVIASLQVDSAISYLVALVIPALDAIFPVLPSETAVIALGVATAGSADPRIALLVAFAAAGAFLGDNLSYLFGRHFGPAVQRRFFATPKGMKGRAWAERSLGRFGMRLIIACRFIPGGRTAVTLTCGLTAVRPPGMKRQAMMSCMPNRPSDRSAHARVFMPLGVAKNLRCTAGPKWRPRR